MLQDLRKLLADSRRIRSQLEQRQDTATDPSPAKTRGALALVYQVVLYIEQVIQLETPPAPPAVPAKK